MESAVLLEIKNVHKSFASVKALIDVSVNVRAGEVHALMGENGAGKSTLIKIFTGVYQKDEGTIVFDGQVFEPTTALDAQLVGISTIYQELNLSPYLSVAENIFLGRELRNKVGMIDWKATQKEAKRRLLDLGIDIDVKKPLKHYSTAIQQMVSIARALVIDAKMIVMDEPTSSLDKKEVEVLFGVIRKLIAMNVAVIYVSHKMDEIFKICDTVTVLKDGWGVGTYPIGELKMVKLLSLMIGKDAGSIIGRTKQHNTEKQNTPVVLSLKHISKGNILHGVDLDIHEGEVVGLAGLLGSGRTEIARIIFGDDLYYSGEIEYCGAKVRFGSPKDAIGAGMAFLSEDRKTEGLFPHMNVSDNMMVVNLPNLTKGGVIDSNEQERLCKEYIDQLAIKTPSAAAIIRNLSGGNQQKVILARWLCMQPKLMILDEPTRGIDVGAKSEIEKLIQNLSDSGIAVLFISSEIEELVRGCDRVAVLYNGGKVCEFVGDQISYEHIMDAIAEAGERAYAKTVEEGAVGL